MKQKKILLAVLLLGLALGVVGCKTTMVGEDLKTQATYSMGTLSAAMPYAIETVFRAAQKSMADLELKTSVASKDSLAGKIIARDSADKKISIELKSVAPNSTGVKIRAGALGDETKSKMIYNKIKENLL
ncbi:MAG: DUF3568 family protein [Phycisphaerae bacterium]|nr:DUF3568 family protein [Phycisphaerae bacterium]